ncbi:MAG TPA: hypothetical protein VFS49_03630, partial [Croceibacterium sp.]|nr:hypothetical protein [Croceibacterium sp.]
MAQSPKSGGRRLSLAVSTAQRPAFSEPLVAYVFDAGGTLVQRADIAGGKLELELPREGAHLPRLVIAPAIKDAPSDETPSLERLLKLGAYEPVLRQDGKLISRIVIPGPIIDLWPFCFCWVRGRVVRASDNRPVCHARVHICEVDRIPIWILRLPDPDIFRLRDDLIEVLQRPPIPRPEPDPGPFVNPGALAGFDPQPDPPSPARRFTDKASRVAFNPQPDPPIARRALRFTDKLSQVALNPQPLPPKESLALPLALRNSLQSHSATTLRQALALNWQLIIPWLCVWPHWWWWFRCDELAVVETDANGRFERFIVYPCHGDHPDLYFWVEYDLGSGFETVYHPPIACNTYWNYACGSEVTIHLTDPRVPACGGPADLPGKQVVVLSLGRTVAVREVGADGLTTAGEPFGEKLEPRVDFSATNLAAAGVPYYQWTYTRLTGPDGSGTTVDPASPPIGVPKVLKREVVRHYRSGTTYVPEPLGPIASPAADLFRIQPADPPAGGDEWVVLDEREDLASAHFETSSLPGSPSSSATDDRAAGLYELRLQLYDGAGNVVDWTAKGIDLRITDQDAPFGTATVTTTAAPAANRILQPVGVQLHTFGFRMVVRVDNNFCSGAIHPVGGTVTPDADCGFHNYSSPSDTTGL